VRSAVSGGESTVDRGVFGLLVLHGEGEGRGEAGGERGRVH